MDGDDAPHAGDDSGKHPVIFAGIRAGPDAQGTKAWDRAQKSLPAGALRPQRLELVPAGDAGHHAQVAAHPFRRDELQVNGVGQVLQGSERGHALTWSE